MSLWLTPVLYCLNRRRRLGRDVVGHADHARDFGLQIEVRCFESKDAVTATVTRLPFAKLEKLASRITTEVPGVVSVTYNITAKPPTTIEAV